MSSENNNQDSGTGNDNAGAGEGQHTAENTAESRVKELEGELAKRDETIGSLKRDIKDFKKSVKDVVEPKETSQTNQQSSEPDYSKIAYLNSIDVKHPDDQKLIVDEAERLKLPLTDIANMEHVKAQLANNLAKRDTQAGMPDKHGRTGGSGAKDVEYYLTHPEEVPSDPEVHNKVIDARKAQEVSSNKWGTQVY